MSWIRVTIGLARHPKTSRLARALGIPRAHAVGILVGLWDYAHQFHINGEIDPSDWPEQAESVGYADHAQLLSALAESGFIDRTSEKCCLHDWDEYQGVEIMRRQANRDRMRRLRAGEKAETAEVLHPRAQNVQGDVRTDVRTNKLRAREEGRGASRRAGPRGPRARPAPANPEPLPDPDRATVAPLPIAETMARLRATLQPEPLQPNGSEPHAGPDPQDR